MRLRHRILAGVFIFSTASCESGRFEPSKSSGVEVTSGTNIDAANRVIRGNSIDYRDSSDPATLSAAAKACEEQRQANSVRHPMLGYAHACGVIDNKLHCWGRQTSGALGNPSVAEFAIQECPLAVQNFSGNASLIRAGINLACALDGPALKCWGSNFENALGNRSLRIGDSSATPVIVENLPTTPSDLSIGSAHVCAVVSGGAYCWGLGSEGQTGNGRSITGQPMSGSDIPTVVHSLPVQSKVQQIAAGNAFTCARVDDGVMCWGSNNSGQLGTNSVLTTSTGSDIPRWVTGLPSNSKVTDIAAGAYHACAVVNGAAVCWGTNGFGQLGNAGYPNGTIQPVQVTGLNANVTAIAVTTNSSCAVVNGGLLCWGQNSTGQIGNTTVPVGFDSITNVANTPVVAGGLIAGSGVVDVVMGGGATCAIFEKGDALCWGYNQLNIIGEGSARIDLQPRQPGCDAVPLCPKN